MNRSNKRTGRRSLPQRIWTMTFQGETLPAGRVSLYHCHPEHERHCLAREEY